jgi:hypothetical protein
VPDTCQIVKGGPSHERHANDHRPRATHAGEPGRFKGFSIYDEAADYVTAFEVTGDLDIQNAKPMGKAEGGAVAVRLDVDSSITEVLVDGYGSEGSDFTGSELYVLERARDALALVCDELERMQGVYGIANSEAIA